MSGFVRLAIAKNIKQRQVFRMKQYTLYLGLNDKDSKLQEVSTIEAFKLVQKLIASSFDGATIFEAVGVYKHLDGTFTTENTLRIELLEIDNPLLDKVRDLVKTLKSVFNQESIAIQIQDVNSDLW